MGGVIVKKLYYVVYFKMCCLYSVHDDRDRMSVFRLTPSHYMSVTYPYGTTIELQGPEGMQRA